MRSLDRYNKKKPELPKTPINIIYNYLNLIKRKYSFKHKSVFIGIGTDTILETMNKEIHNRLMELVVLHRSDDIFIATLYDKSSIFFIFKTKRINNHYEYTPIGYFRFIKDELIIKLSTSIVTSNELLLVN
nr:MAG TPA: hypothetical protein [Caudoviricetes sp.]